MKWICETCNWTGSYDELESDLSGNYCPQCDGKVFIDDDRDPDPLDDENQTFRNVEVSALCAEWNL